MYFRKLILIARLSNKYNQILKIIDKYLISAWLKWFILSFLVLYSLLFIQFLNEDNIFLGNGPSLPVIKLFLFKAVTFLPWLFPIICFVSTILTFSFLAKNRELLALVSNGFSTLSISLPILGLALVCSVFAWFFQDTERIVDWFDANFDKHAVSDDKKNSSFKMVLDKVNRTWFFDKYESDTGFAHNIHLYCYDDYGNDLYRISSQSGQKTKNGWKFNNGTFLGFGSSKGIPVIKKNNQLSWAPYLVRSDKKPSMNTNIPRYQKEFNEIELPHVKDDPEPFALLRVRPKDLNYKDLAKIVNSYPEPNSPKLLPYRLRSAQLFWNAPACFFAVMCALAIAIRREQYSIGVTIGLSLIWIIVFYIIRTFCEAFGKLGIFSDWISTGIPFITIFLISMGILWRNR